MFVDTDSLSCIHPIYLFTYFSRKPRAGLSVRPRLKRPVSPQVRAAAVACPPSPSNTHGSPVSCHSLLDAPPPLSPRGATVDHDRLLLPSLHPHRRQGRTYLTVAHLSHSARLTFVLQRGRSARRRACEGRSEIGQGRDGGAIIKAGEAKGMKPLPQQQMRSVLD